MARLRSGVLLAFAGLMGVGSLSPPARAEPVVKVVNFTADWCPNCLILNPRLTEAAGRFDPDEVAIINLDMSGARRGTPEPEIEALERGAAALAQAHKAGYLWDWYGGTTAIAVVVAADTGEPLSCLMRPLSTDAIAKRLRLALILARHARPGERKPDGPDCPAPTRR